jgi:hypothetical protein
MSVFPRIQPFAFTDHTGCPRVVHVGELMADSDKDFKGRESMFEPVETAAARPALRAAGVMEDATAEPNTKRSVRPRRP